MSASHIIEAIKRIVRGDVAGAEEKLLELSIEDPRLWILAIQELNELYGNVIWRTAQPNDIINICMERYNDTRECMCGGTCEKAQDFAKLFADHQICNDIYVTKSKIKERCTKFLINLLVDRIRV